MNSILQDIFGQSTKVNRQRPRVLVFPFDFLSHTLRCLQLANILRDDVEFIFAHSRRYGQHIEQQNFPTFEFVDSDADIVLEHSVRFDFGWMNDAELRRVLNLQLTAIRKYEPDIVLGDVSMTLNMAAEICNVPCVKLVNGYMSKYYACTRPLPSSHPMSAITSLLPSWISEPLTSMGENVLLRYMHRVFGRIRREYKLRPQQSFLDELAGQTTLICDLPLLFPQRALPVNYHIIGPLYHRDASDETDALNFVSNGKQTILVSLGSTGDSEHFGWLHSNSLRDTNILLSGRDINSFRAANIYAKPFMNHMAVLPHCDVLVCHGGNGTIYQALEHAVPILARPNFFEQEYNMQRVGAMGLGQVIAKRASDEEIIGLINLWSGRKNSPQLQLVQSELMSYLSR